MITQMWFAGNLLWPTFGNTTVRVYVDGDSSPQIQFTLFMMAGLGFDHTGIEPWGQRRIGITALSGGVYSTIRIPFNDISITAELPPMELPARDGEPFYFIVRGINNMPLEIGGLLLPSDARLRLAVIEQEQEQPDEIVTLVSSFQPGLLYLVSMQAQSSNLHYLEGAQRFQSLPGSVAFSALELVIALYN